MGEGDFPPNGFRQREYRSTSGCDRARPLVRHENDTCGADDAFSHLERRRDRAIGKQPLASAQRDWIDHQPERIDQVMLHERLQEMTTAPHI